MQKRSAAQLRQIMDNRRAVLAALSDVAAEGIQCPPDRVLGERIGLSQSAFARCVLALIKDGKITSRRDGPCRVVTILATGKATLPFKKAQQPAERERHPIKRVASKIVPEVANRAMTDLRKRGLVCYAERYSEASTDLTGGYIVNKEVLTLAELLARAGQRIAA